MPRKTFRIACAAALSFAALVPGSAGASGPGTGQTRDQVSGAAHGEGAPRIATDPVARIVAQLERDGDRADAAPILEWLAEDSGGTHLRLA